MGLFITTVQTRCGKICVRVHKLNVHKYILKDTPVILCTILDTKTL